MKAMCIGVLIALIIIGGIFVYNQRKAGNDISLEVITSEASELIQKPTNLARAAGAKTTISSTVKAINVCLISEEYISEPEAGKHICGTSGTTWPDLGGVNATWGGCPMEVDRNQGMVTYCATIDGVVATCTNEGCSFESS